MEKTKVFLFYWLPVVIYCLAIFIQSSFPSSEKISQFPHVDKLLHMGGYGLLGILFFRAYKTTSLGSNMGRVVLLSILSASLYGVSDEIHQYFVPSRTADIIDALAGTAGSVLGVTACYMIFNKKFSH